ncbi:GNAT family N-acetyltransferase [Nocardia sp. NPDC050406]|uniref:GNAT family N-acetyltransferase n=1 Tax=Nocardia sp. NPDC050406 TaxID=3364318 RepID=UPI0037B495F6
MSPRDAVTRSALRRVRLGPVLVAGHRVVVRNTRLSDFPRWRELRLRDRRFIEPFWVTSALSWEERHRRRWWIREYLRQRRAMAAGRALPLSIEVDGEFAGQCNLMPIDPINCSAELGIWMDSRRAGEGVGSIAGGLVTDYGLGPLGLRRITAPAALGNRVARQSALRSGMILEATMIEAMSVNGRRRDHELWAITTTTAPPGGFVAALVTAGIHARYLPEEERSLRTRWNDFRRATVAASPPAVLAVATRYYLGAPLRWRWAPAPALLDVITGTDADGRSVSLRKRTGHWAFRRTRRVRYDAVAAGEPLGRLLLDHGEANARVTLEFSPEAAFTAAATTAVALLVDYAMNGLRIERLEARIDPADAHLAKLASAGGLRHEGVLAEARRDPDGGFHDVELWAATPSGATPSD